MPTTATWFESESVMQNFSGECVLSQRLGAPSDEGVVHKATFRQILPAAIKFVDPDHVDKNAIEAEVRLLSLLRHSHLVKITDFGVGHPRPVRVDGSRAVLPPSKQYFYIAMEHVPGRPLDDVWKGLTARETLLIFDQLLDVTVYLHDRGVLQMDLKPRNVLVEESNRNVVLIDLGFSLVAYAERFRQAFGLVDAQINMLVDGEEVYVASTREYTRESRRASLNQRVKRSDLQNTWFPDHDLYAFGMLISEAITQVDLDRKSPSIAEGLRIMRDRLIHREYALASDVQSDLRRLDPRTLAPLSVPELSPVAERGGGYITLSTMVVQVTERVFEIINRKRQTNPSCQPKRRAARLAAWHDDEVRKRSGR